MKERIPRRDWEPLAVLLITALAAVLRLYALTTVPPGLHYDEAFKGVNARDLLAGAPLRLFFESNMGEEPTAIYLTAAVLGLAGQQPWLIRLPSALIGILTVPLTWWLGRELFRTSGAQASGAREGERAGRWIGLTAALVLSILYWHLSFSRIGMEPILVPFFMTLTFASLARGLNTGRRWAFILAGAALGGCLYTYKAGYFVPVVVLLYGVHRTVVEQRFLRRQGSRLLIMALAALLVAAPIIGYWVGHPVHFWHRPTSVALAFGGVTPEGGLGPALANNLVRTMGMFFVEGDANPRSNLPGRPVLDPFLALLFLVGLGRALVKWRRPSFALLVVWLAVMILPTIVTEYAPHFGRSIGATPAVALLCALGGWVLWQAARSTGRAWLQRAMMALLTVGFIASTASTVRAYFGEWGRSPDLFYAYDVGLVKISEYVNTLPADQEVYLTPTSAAHYTLQFLVRRPLASFDGRHGRVFPPSGQAATVIVLLREDKKTLPALQRSRPDGQVSWTLTDDLDRPYAAAYFLPASAAPAPRPAKPVDAVLSDGAGQARLLGYDLQPPTAAPGDRVVLTLYWQSLAPFDADYTVFTHLLGNPDPASGGPLWTGHDAQPNGGHYPTTAWRPGEVILDIHPLVLPAEIPPGEYPLEAGLYLLSTMTRLSATDAAGHPLPDNAVPLGTLQVGE